MPRAAPRRALAYLAAVALITATCIACASHGGADHPSSAGGHAAPRATASHPSDPHTGASGSGCGGTQVHRGHPPSWATGGFHGSITVPYALSAHKKVVAYLWGYPLATHTGSFKDKILWFVKDLGLLHIHGHLVGAAKPVFSEIVGSGGGGTGMPSYVKAPAPGCWHLTLTWNGHRDTMNLRYVAHR